MGQTFLDSYVFFLNVENPNNLQISNKCILDQVQSHCFLSLRSQTLLDYRINLQIQDIRFHEYSFI